MSRNRLYANPDQFWLPLSTAVAFQPVCASTEVRPVWSAAETRALHQGLLERSLKHLADPRLGQQIREELLDWVREAVEPSEAMRPFSFRACVYFLDPALDAEALARQVAYQVRRIARHRPPAAALHPAA